MGRYEDPLEAPYVAFKPILIRNYLVNLSDSRSIGEIQVAKKVDNFELMNTRIHMSFR